MDAPTNDFSGMRVTVAGLGHFGGNIAAAKWLVSQGAKVLVTDRSPAEKFADALPQLADLPIEYRLGEHRESDFTQADLVVASPAISPANLYLQAAKNAGVPVTTEICLFSERCRARVVGISGTKGKSTTSAMLQSILSRRFTTWFGGNIGKSLLADLPQIAPDHLVVLELSSFMLDYLGAMAWSPHVAVLTLLAADHLDWHGSFGAYAEAKRNLLRYQKPGDIAVVNEESHELMEWGRGGVANVIPYGVNGRGPFELALPGRHNQLNAQGAYAAAAALGVPREEAQSALLEFTGLPHRLQLVHESGGVRWFNDSIATVPEAAIAALEAFNFRRVIQIVGGSDKGLDLAGMVAALAHRAKAVLCIGATGGFVAELLRSAGAADVRLCGDLKTATAAAGQIAQPGDVVLLSTGFASYDQFVNFQDRGDQFAAAARMVPSPGTPGEGYGGGERAKEEA